MSGNLRISFFVDVAPGVYLHETELAERAHELDSLLRVGGEGVAQAELSGALSICRQGRELVGSAYWLRDFWELSCGLGTTSFAVPEATLTVTEIDAENVQLTFDPLTQVLSGLPRANFLREWKSMTGRVERVRAALPSRFPHRRLRLWQQSLQPPSPYAGLLQPELIDYILNAPLEELLSSRMHLEPCPD